VSPTEAEIVTLLEST